MTYEEAKAIKRGTSVWWMGEVGGTVKEIRHDGALGIEWSDQPVNADLGFVHPADCQNIHLVKKA